jgi:pyruvate kinase
MRNVNASAIVRLSCSPVKSPLTRREAFAISTDPDIAGAMRSPAALLEEILALRAAITQEAAQTMQLWRPHIRRRAFLAGAVNLSHYLALRRRDLSALQEELAYWGLSSLGRSEARVRANLDSVAATLAALAGGSASIDVARPKPSAYRRGPAALRREARALFGLHPEGPSTRIMVTLPSEAATEPALVSALMDAGADCGRINCAHDGPQEW